jgi:hypothetical protein
MAWGDELHPHLFPCSQKDSSLSRKLHGMSSHPNKGFSQAFEWSTKNNSTKTIHIF